MGPERRRNAWKWHDKWLVSIWDHIFFGELRKTFLNLRSDRGKAEITAKSKFDVGLSNQMPISADFDWKSNTKSTRTRPTKSTLKTPIPCPTIPLPNRSFANPPQHSIHIFDKNMPSQTDSSVVADTRTPQQKAAATRKANKAAEEKKSREQQDSAGE